MYEYFTIMFKENDTSNMKLLTEKLNEGFHINDRTAVGRSTILTLAKSRQEETNDTGRLSISGGERPVSVRSGYSHSDVPF